MAKPTADTSSHSTSGTVYEILPKDGVETTSWPLNPTVTATNAVAVTGVSVASTLSVSVGQTKYLTPTVAPTNAINKNVTWVSGTPAKATINKDGGVLGVAAGTSVITVTSVDNGTKTATCTVTVS